MSYELGRAAGVEALESGTQLKPMFAAALAVRVSAPGAQMLAGLLAVLCLALDACGRQGIKFALSDEAAQIADALPKARQLLVFAVCQSIDDKIVGVLNELCAAVATVRFNTTTTAGVPAQNPPEPVLRMQIVGLPERTTNTSLTRGSDGVLIGSMSVEQDV